MDQPENVAALDFQHVDKVVVVTGDNVAMVLGDIPVLIGDGRYLDLDKKKGGTKVYFFWRGGGLDNFNLSS